MMSPVLRPVRLFRRLACAWLSCALFLGACKSSEPTPEWVSDKVIAASDRVLAEVTMLAFEKTGFPAGGGLQPGQHKATSGWLISLAPFRGKGFREQCEIEFKPESDRNYTAHVRVRRQKNDDLVKPLDISYAVWLPEPDNAERARIVLQYIKSMLGTDFVIDAKRARPGDAPPPKPR